MRVNDEGALLGLEEAQVNGALQRPGGWKEEVSGVPTRPLPLAATRGDERLHRACLRG
jgi:hypothetical protein